MVVTQDQSADTPTAPETETEAPTLTAKQLAEAEEANQARARAIINRQQEMLAREQALATEPTIIEVAAQGRDALEAALRQHAAATTVPEYVPPPRTPRQMQQLEAELEAGRKAQERAQEQFDNRPAPPDEVAKEGFTVPVHRPGDFVPGINSRNPAIS